MPAVQLRITVVQPPPGVMFSLQDRAKVLSQQTLSTGADITFTLAVERDAGGRVLGKFAMGPPAQRFLYICSGTSAGQFGTCWTRRAKISLTNLPATALLEGEIQGRAKDGGPACATVPLLRGGWRPAHDM